MMRQAVLLLILILPAVLAPSAGSLPAARFTIDVQGKDVTIAPPPAGVNITLNDTKNDSIKFLVTTPTGTAIGNVTLKNRFMVDRARQVVPRVDDEIPAEVDSASIEITTVAAFNLSATGGTLTFALALPAGNHTVSFTRDVTPPVPHFESQTDPTPTSTVVVTTTDEPAVADLVVQSARRGNVTFHTPNAAYRQTFPLSGLDPDTDYEYVITYHDYSDNVAASATHRFHTPPAPALVPPRIEVVVPVNGSSVAGPVTRIQLRVVDNSSKIVSLLLYLDKNATPDLTGSILLETVLYEVTPAISAPGRHTVVAEATNALGATGRLFASFTISPRASPAFASWALALAGGLAALVLNPSRSPGARRRGPSRRP